MMRWLKIDVWSLVLLLATVLPNNIYASHLAGSDLSYAQVPNQPAGVLMVTLTVYRDCAGVPVCTGTCNTICSRQISVSTLQSNGNLSTLFNVNLSLVSHGIVKNSDCVNSKGACTNNGCEGPGNNTLPGYEKYTFQGVIDVSMANPVIPSGVCKVYLTNQLCCRPGNITSGAGGQNAYFSIWIDRCMLPPEGNSSPTFTNDPPTYTYANQPFFWNGAALDKEADSLSYHLVPIKSSFTVNNNYLPQYTYLAPVPSINSPYGSYIGNFRCNPITGDISCVPFNSELPKTISPIAYEVVNWKRQFNGTYVATGISRREFLLTVYKAIPTNNYPHIATDSSAPFNQPITELEVCAGERLCIDILGKDIDSNLVTGIDTTYLSWNASLAHLGATFLPNYQGSARPREDSYKFCWQPHDTLARQEPYSFLIMLKDSKCPLPGAMSRIFRVKVKTAAVVIQKTYGTCGKVKLNYISNTQYPQQVYSHTQISIAKKPFDYSFANGSIDFFNVKQTPYFVLDKPGKYLVRLSITLLDTLPTACTKVFYDTLIMDKAFKPTLGQSYRCGPGKISLVASTPIYAPSHKFIYSWFGQYPDTLTPSTDTANGGATLFDSIGQSKWYYLRSVNEQGCVYWDSTYARVLQVPQINLPDSVITCNGNATLIDAGRNNDNVKKYLWNTGDTSQAITKSTQQHYWVTLTDTMNCVNTDTVFLLAKQAANVDAGSNIQVCTSEKEIRLNQYAGATAIPATTQMYWLTNDPSLNRFIAGNNLRLDSLALPGVGKTWTLYYESRDKDCPSRDSIMLSIANSPDVKVGFDSLGTVKHQQVCLLKSVVPLYTFVNGVKATGDSTSYKGTINWQSSSGSGNNAFFSTLDTLKTGNQLLVFQYASQYQTFSCANADTAIVTITPSVYRALASHQQVCYQTPTKLKASTIGGKAPYHFWWYTIGADTTLVFSEQVSDTSIATIAMPSTSTNYWVKTTDANNCESSLTVQLKVNPLPTSTLIDSVIICHGSSYTADATSPFSYSYRWHTGEQTPLKVIANEGTYFVTYTDTLMCSVTDSILAIYAPPFVANAGIDLKVCAQQPFQLNAGGADEYEWRLINTNQLVKPRSSTSVLQFPTGNNAGKYFYEVSVFRLNNGSVYAQSYCVTKDTVQVEVVPAFKLTPILGNTIVENRVVAHTYLVPDETETQYKWMVDGGIVMEGQGTHKVLVKWPNNGEGRIWLTAMHDDICSDSANIKVLVRDSRGLTKYIRSMMLYPNPNDGEFTLSLELFAASNINLTIHDMLGKLQWSSDLSLTEGINQINVSQQLKSGAYLLKVADNSGLITEKLVIR